MKNIRDQITKVKHVGLFCVIIFSMSCSKQEEAVSCPETEVEDTTGDTTVITPPIIQTPSPVIHLADNLDEQDQLGYCIDTQGNGFNANLHAHSCKASGGDVQFIYNENTRQICSFEFTDFCVEMSGGPEEGMSLILAESDTNSSDQKFIYYEDSGEFVPEDAPSLCLAVGETSAAAGIYMYRSLTLALSSETDVVLKKWVILD